MINELLVGKVIEKAKTGANSGKCGEVYDKKLLWRANLYIDETRNPANGDPIPGAVDWNNIAANRWTAAQGNEWDTVGDGGQCVIRPWTRPYYEPEDPTIESKFTYEDQMEYAAVAYTALGRDTPLDFNADLLDQMEATQHYENNPAHNTTLALTNDDWLTYIDHTKQYNGSEINTNTYQPYRPVFSSVIKHLNNGFPFYDENWNFTNNEAAGFSAGTNCNGLTLQSAAYNGSNYMYADVNIGPRLDWGRNYGGAYPRGDYVWIMWDEENQAEYGQQFNLIVPGDMVDMAGHTGVIATVVFADDSRSINRSRCKIIEASSPFFDYRVIKNRSIQNHINTFSNFKIVRLTTN